jgi:hypothetical protein
MAKFTTKIVFSNSHERPHTIWVEPVGEDFTLLPGESLEIISRGNKTPSYFSVVETEGNTQAYIENKADGFDVLLDFDVLQGGHKLKCGHNRKAALDAGLWSE